MTILLSFWLHGKWKSFDIECKSLSDIVTQKIFRVIWWIVLPLLTKDAEDRMSEFRLSVVFYCTVNRTFQELPCSTAEIFFLIWLDTKYLVMMALFQKSNVNEKCQVTYIGKSHNCFVRQVSKKRCQISIGSCQEAGRLARTG